MAKNKQIIYWIIFVLVVLLIGGWIYQVRNGDSSIITDTQENDSATTLLSTTQDVKSETIVVQAFFNNSNLDPEFSCNKVFPVTREIEKTSAVGRASLMELLKGPTSKEKSDGFFTSLNDNVKLQSLTIENGIAKADFDTQLGNQVGGSCRVSAIRAQITQTLKQFPTVHQVIISIDGHTEDILQP